MNLTKYILLPLLLVAGGISASALTPREAFIKAPADIIETIDSITRLDMLDYYDSGSSVASRNAFGGEASVRSANDVSITVSTSNVAEVTLIPLAAGRDSVLLVINTLALPTPDSYAVTYDQNWHLATGMSLPDHNSLDLWMLPSGRNVRDKIENAIPFVPAIYTFNDGTLTMTQTLSKLIPADDYTFVKPYLRPSISFKWTGKNWKQVK
ncbi:MAG: DUF3256 family protein [Muribaculaceae bacterium]|nr:DUF3256 family protein [Muribaculaceae bacterium]